MIRSSRGLALAAALGTVTALSAFLPADASAQRRAVGRPPAHRVVVARPVLAPVPYGFYAPFYGLSLGWYSWGGWYSYAFYGPPHPYWHRAPYGDHPASARLLVEPRHAEVYVDGYYVGTVDEFDGWAQRLRVPPGERTLEIYLDGYRTYRQPVLFRPGSTIRIHHALEPLQPGEAAEPRPAPSRAPAGRPTRREYPGGDLPGRGGRTAPAQGDHAEPQTYGSLTVRVHPADAEIIVNGETWESPATGDLTVQLAGGRHEVEVRRAGFRPYRATVEVRPGETATINVGLSRQDR